MTFVLTAYLLLITEAIGTYVGIHFLWIAKETSNAETSDFVEDWKPALIASNSNQTLVTQNPIAEGRVVQPEP
jgi:hypothetical protein